MTISAGEHHAHAQIAWLEESLATLDAAPDPPDPFRVSRALCEACGVMHQFAANARDIALGAILVRRNQRLRVGADGRCPWTRPPGVPDSLGWAVLAAVVATTTVVAGIDAGDPPTDNLDAAADEMAVLIVGIQPFAFSFGLIGPNTASGGGDTALDE